MDFKRICKALYKYEAVEEGELSFEEDALLYVWDDVNPDWWNASLEMGSTEGELTVGLIPYNYVEELEPVSQAISLYNYEAQNNDELSFEEGAKMLVYQKEGEDWMLVHLNGRFGFVPQTYVEEMGIEGGDEAGEEAEEPELEEYIPEPVPEPISQNSIPKRTPSYAESKREIVKDDMLFWRVSEVDKKKKKKGKVRLGISSTKFFVTREEEKGAPTQTFPISELIAYSVRNKHILIEIVGREDIFFDFSCSNVKQAEAIAYKIRNSSKTVSFKEKPDKGSGGIFGIFKKKSSKPALPPASRARTQDRSSVQSQKRSSQAEDSLGVLKDRYESVPLPKLPQAEVEKASAQQRQYYPEAKSTTRSSKSASLASASQAPVNQKEGKAAIVLFDFEAAEDVELSVQADQMVYVMDKELDGEWWKCRLYKDDGSFSQGFVPAEYITIIPKDPIQVEPREPVVIKKSGNPDPAKVREWTDHTGAFRVEAEFTHFEDDKFHLHKTNGVKIAVPLEKMSAKDIEYVSNRIGKNLSEMLESNSQLYADVKKWDDFFGSCGIQEALARDYGKIFAKEKIDRVILKDMDRSTLKSLGLKEGDAIRVLKAVKTGLLTKAPKAKRSVTFSSEATVMNVDSKMDEELALQLQQEEIERVRKEKASGGLVEAQIEQDEMLARKLQEQSGDTSTWKDFISEPSSSDKKYGLGLSGGLSSKSGKPSKAGVINPETLFQASALFEQENLKDAKSKSKPQSGSGNSSKTKKSGFDDDEIWGAPGAKVEYDKLNQSPKPSVKVNESDGTYSPKPEKKTPSADPWAVFEPSQSQKQSKGSESAEKPVFSSNNTVRKESKNNVKVAETNDWGFISSNLQKVNTAPQQVPSPQSSFATFSQTATQPSQSIQKPQPQYVNAPVSINLAQPLIPVPNQSSSSNVFVPTRRAAPPKPKQEVNVFADTIALSTNNLFATPSPSISSSNQPMTGLDWGNSKPSSQSAIPDLFGPDRSASPAIPNAAQVLGKPSIQSASSLGQASNHMGFSSNISGPVAQTQPSLSSITSNFQSESFSTSSNTPFAHQTQLSSNNSHNYQSPSSNLATTGFLNNSSGTSLIGGQSLGPQANASSSFVKPNPSNLGMSSSRSALNSTTSANYQFDDLSLSSLGIASPKPPTPQPQSNLGLSSVQFSDSPSSYGIANQNNNFNTGFIGNTTSSGYGQNNSGMAGSLPGASTQLGQGISSYTTTLSSQLGSVGNGSMGYRSSGSAQIGASMSSFTPGSSQLNQSGLGNLYSPSSLENASNIYQTSSNLSNAGGLGSTGSFNQPSGLSQTSFSNLTQGLSRDVTPGSLNFNSVNGSDLPSSNMGQQGHSTSNLNTISNFSNFSQSPSGLNSHGLGRPSPNSNLSSMTGYGNSGSFVGSGLSNSNLQSSNNLSTNFNSQMGQHTSGAGMSGLGSSPSYGVNSSLRDGISQSSLSGLGSGSGLSGGLNSMSSNTGLGIGSNSLNSFQNQSQFNSPSTYSSNLNSSYQTSTTMNSSGLGSLNQGFNSNPSSNVSGNNSSFGMSNNTMGFMSNTASGLGGYSPSTNVGQGLSGLNTNQNQYSTSIGSSLMNGGMNSLGMNGSNLMNGGMNGSILNQNQSQFNQSPSQFNQNQLQFSQNQSQFSQNQSQFSQNQSQFSQNQNQNQFSQNQNQFNPNQYNSNQNFNSYQR